MATVGYATLQIIPSARGFGTALSAQTNGQMATAGAVGGKKFGGGLLGSLKSIAGPIAAIAGATAIAGFLKGAVAGASDLEETVAKVSVVFGDAAKQVEKFSKDSSRNILLTQQEALDASATFGIFGKSAGLTGKELGTFSTDLTALASDLSSFYNATTDETIVALGAALRGESEPIRRFGVLLDDASLRAEALKQGLISTTKQALTPQQRVLAAQALILKQTSDAQGDAARTSQNLANQQRILRKNFDEIRITVGNALLPVVTGFVQFLNANLLPAFEAVKTAGKPLVDFFKGLGDSAGAGGGFTDALAKTGAVIKDFFAAFAPVAIELGNKLKATLGPAIKSIVDIFSNQLLPAFQAFIPAVRPIVVFLARVFGGAIIGALNGALNVVKGVLKVLAGLFNAIAGVLTGDWKRLWEGIKQIVSGVWDAIKGIVQVALNIGVVKLFRTAGSLIVNGAKAAFGALKTTVDDVLGTIVRTVAGLPGNILKGLGNLKTTLIQAGKDMLGGFITGIKSMASAIIASIKATITDALPGFVKKALGIASPSKVFIEIGKNVGKGFIKGIQGTRDQIRSVFEDIIKDVKELGNNKLLKAVKDAQEKILKAARKRDFLREQFDGAKDALRDLRDEAKSYIDSIKDAVIQTGNISNANSFADIVKNLTDAVSNARAFNSVISALKAQGLNSSTLQDLVEAGPSEALASAQALLAAGQTGIAAVNTLQSELEKQGQEIGKTISGAVYDAAIADAEKAVKSIGNDLRRIEKDIVQFGARLAREIAKIGKIPAPAWLKDLVGVTNFTANKSVGGASTPSGNAGSNKSGSSAKQSGSTVTINNYNPIGEPTSVTVSNTLTRLALLGLS
jgi:hypothetical protein